ncbi:hypothetical protein BH23ACT10_BH23ACT10_10850 [soil metagenome]
MRICFTWTDAGPEDVEIAKDALGDALAPVERLRTAS